MPCKVRVIFVMSDLLTLGLLIIVAGLAGCIAFEFVAYFA